MLVRQIARYIAADKTQRVLVSHAGGSDLYYKSSSDVSSGSKDGTLKSGESGVTFSAGVWVISASQTTLDVQDVTETADPTGKDLATQAELDGATADIAVLKEAPLNIEDAAYGADGTGATAADAAFKAALAAMPAAGGEIFLPRTYLINSTVTVPSGVTFEGTGIAASSIKAGGEIEMFKTADFGSGGASKFTFRNLAIDGNSKATYGLNLDGYAYQLDRIWVHDCKGVGWFSKKSGAATNDIVVRCVDSQLIDNAGGNIDYEGPTDPQCARLECRLNSETKANVTIRTIGEWDDVHAYGNATFSIDVLGAAQFSNCIAEGGRNGQVAIRADSVKWYGGHLFDGGGSDGKIGFVIGDASHTANGLMISWPYMQKLVNGCFKFNEKSAPNSRISAWVELAEKEAIVGPTEPNSSIQWDLQVVGGGTIGKNPAMPSVASASTITVPNFWMGRPISTKVTGNEEIKKITAMPPRTELTLIFTGTPKIVDGENLKLVTTMEATADDTLTLICDGTNWFEKGRAAN